MSFSHLAGLVLILVAALPARAELLGSISDDTAPKAQPEPAPAGKSDGRRIVYRVICSPEDHDLPDCDRAAVDETGATDNPASLPTPDLPPDKEDQAEAAEPVAAAPTKVQSHREAKSRSHSKTPSPRKQAKKAQAAAKKPAAGKRPHK